VFTMKGKRGQLINFLMAILTIITLLGAMVAILAIHKDKEIPIHESTAILLWLDTVIDSYEIFLNRTVTEQLDGLILSTGVCADAIIMDSECISRMRDTLPLLIFSPEEINGTHRFNGVGAPNPYLLGKGYLY